MEKDIDRFWALVEKGDKEEDLLPYFQALEYVERRLSGQPKDREAWFERIAIGMGGIARQPAAWSSVGQEFFSAAESISQDGGTELLRLADLHPRNPVQRRKKQDLIQKSVGLELSSFEEGLRYAFGRAELPAYVEFERSERNNVGYVERLANLTGDPVGTLSRLRADAQSGEVIAQRLLGQAL